MEQEMKVKRPGKMILLAGILTIVVGIGIFYWIKFQSFETTDNAQVDCNIIPVRSVVTAFVKTICFNDNEYIKKGQVLFVFDTTELKAKYIEADEALKIARAKLLSAQNKASSSIENAKAGSLTSLSYEQAIASAKANFEKAQSNNDRINALFIIKAATKEQVENAGTSLSIAKSDYEKAISSQESSSATTKSLKSLARSDQNQITLAQAQVSQCEAELALASCQLSYAIIYAPCNGIVTKRTVQIGQYVSAGQNLCALVENDNLWVTANFKETQLKNLKTGQDVIITIDAFPDLLLSGKIESFSGATGARYALLPPDNATGNFIKIAQRIPVRISITRYSKDNVDRLFPGLSAYVKVRKN